MQAVLPFHGDEVSEPLVRHLVVDDNCHPLFGSGWRRGGIDQNSRLPKCHQPPVLHGPHSKVSDGDAVILLQRVRNPVKVLVICDGLHARVQSKLALLENQFSHLKKWFVIKDLVRKQTCSFFPSGVYTRTLIPSSDSPSTYSYSPTINATK